MYKRNSIGSEHILVEKVACCDFEGLVGPAYLVAY